MLQYILAGLALGAIYAIASAGLVVTFVSTGVLNFAFGSMAFVVARFYYYLNTQHGGPPPTPRLLSLLVMAPLLGVFLYAVLFRFLRDKSTLVKIVATIGLSVALPPISDLIFGAQSITTAPGLRSPPTSPIASSARRSPPIRSSPTASSSSSWSQARSSSGSPGSASTSGRASTPRR